MNRIQDRSILFYTTFDPFSKQILTELSKFPMVQEQIILIQLNDAKGNINRTLPRMIKNILQKNPRKIPIFVPAGMNNVVFGPHVISMLQDGILNNLNGLVTGTMNRAMAVTSAVLDRSGNLTKRDLFHDSEFHMSTEEVKSIKDFTQDYVSADHVDDMLLMSDNTSKKQAARDIRAKFEEARNGRSSIMPMSSAPTSSLHTRGGATGCGIIDPRPVPAIPPPPMMRPHPGVYATPKKPKKPKKSKRKHTTRR